MSAAADEWYKYSPVEAFCYQWHLEDFGSHLLPPELYTTQGICYFINDSGI